MTDPFKDALRATMKQVRNNTSIHYQATSSHQICNRIRTLELYRKAKRLALYFAVDGEIDLSLLWKTAPLQGKFCYFPSINEDLTLSFLPATPVTPFRTNRFGIEEPDVTNDAAIAIDDLDLIIMPMLAFDVHCTRLGMGAGYYDRTLAHKKRGHLFGVAYQFQQVEFIAPQYWDVPLDAIITQKDVYWRHKIS